MAKRNIGIETRDVVTVRTVRAGQLNAVVCRDRAVSLRAASPRRAWSAARGRLENAGVARHCGAEGGQPAVVTVTHAGGPAASTGAGGQERVIVLMPHRLVIAAPLRLMI